MICSELVPNDVETSPAASVFTVYLKSNADMPAPKIKSSEPLT